MKKSIVRLFVLGVLGFSGVLASEATINYNLSQDAQHVSDYSGCKHGRCHATAKSTGQRCKHCVSNPGDLYCWQH